MLKPDPLAPLPAALYVHVPFCRARCAYCDFARVVRTADGVARYLTALEEELARRVVGPFAPRTVYFGGGTPTSLETAELARLLELLARHVDLSRLEEFTVEANPGTITPEKLARLRAQGVNRLSLGAQSFQPRLLKLLGRIHTADEARAAVGLARAAGFTNLSLDLMHGLPTETREELSADLDAALALEPEHLSAYGLTYEEGTPLAAATARGEIPKLTSEEEAAQYRLVMERLEAGGVRQYEISNYARPGREARHNLVYWRNEAYLGVGPSAASYAGGERTVNAADLEEWAQGIAARGEAVATRERLSGEKRAREALILELRLRVGVEPWEFRARWNFDFEAACGTALERFRAQGVMERTGAGRWRIARAGLPVADTILSELV